MVTAGRPNVILEAYGLTFDRMPSWSMVSVEHRSEAARADNAHSLGSTLFLVGVVVTLPALIVAMAFTWLGAYFTIEGSADVTPSEIGTYDALAAVSVVLGVAGLAVSGAGKRWGFLVAVSVVLGAAVIAVLLFAVPRDAWFSTTTPKQSHLPSDYQPCYSDSPVCGPGG
jgi:hypothetical protein